MDSLRSAYFLFYFLPSRQAINSIKTARWDDALKMIALLLFAGGVAWAEFVFFNRFWTLLHDVPFGFVIILPNAFSYFGSFLFAFLVYSSILTALHSLYRSQDFHLLLQKPIRLEVVLLYKWFDIAIRSGMTLFALTLPIMASLGMSLDWGWKNYAAFLLAVSSLSAIGVSVGVVLAMALMFIFPAKRMHQTMSILGLCIAVLLITGFRFLHIETLWSEAADKNPLFVFLQREPSAWVRYGPGELLARALAPFLGEYTGNWGWLRLCMGMGAFSIAATVIAGATLFTPGWMKNQAQADPVIRKSLFSFGGAQRTWGEGRIMAMLRKDWLLLRRDPAIWTQLFMMVPLAALYMLNLSLLPTQLEGFQRLFAVTNIGLVAMLTAVIGARFLFPTASREGKAVWALSTSPLSPFFVIGLKALFALPPVFIAGGVMLIGSCVILQLTDGLLGWSLAFGFFFILQISVLALALGYCFPMYRHRNLMEVSLGKGAFLFMAMVVLEVGGWTYFAIKHIFVSPPEAIPFGDFRQLLWLGGWMAITGMAVVWGALRLRWLES